MRQEKLAQDCVARAWQVQGSEGGRGGLGQESLEEAEP